MWLDPRADRAQGAVACRSTERTGKTGLQAPDETGHQLAQRCHDTDRDHRGDDERLGRLRIHALNIRVIWYVANEAMYASANR
jgi:hypothetical protein